MTTPVAILFADHDSVYKTLPHCHVYDLDRDARTYRGPWPVVAHPPCRGWCRLRKLSHATAAEKALAVWAVSCVRCFGGVLEHPMGSALWPHLDLPRAGDGPDRFGGFTLAVAQHDWGHMARKRTWLYLCGHVVGRTSCDVDPADVPVGAATRQVGHAVDANSQALEEVGHAIDGVSHKPGQRPSWVPALPPARSDEPAAVLGSSISGAPRLPRKEWSATPLAFAKWLCAAARAAGVARVPPLGPARSSPEAPRAPPG